MRSVAAGSFERLSDREALWHAYQKCRRSKARTPSLAAFDIDADAHVLALGRTLRDGSFRPGPWQLRVIRDPKVRLIAAPPVIDRVVHRALIDEIGGAYERGFSPDHFACGRGRGPHRAGLRFLTLSRRYAWRLHLDVSRYFPSMHIPTLRALLHRRLGDVQTKSLIDLLLEAHTAVYASRLARQVLKLDERPLPPDAGMSLGSYLSQWCGALYLDGLDHFVKRELKVEGYLRYMDDFVLFGDDRERLVTCKSAIAAWLTRERRLTLNPKRDQVEATAQPRVFLGFRVARGGFAPSRKLRRRVRRRIRAAATYGEDALARTVASYRGLLCF